MTLISVCMIVKNEEAVLGRCLDSIDGLWDELIIVDTGSTDCTIEIAESYGAKVLHYEWIAPGHKGEARNVGIDKAVGQWIVVVDADEVVIDAAQMRKDIEAVKEADAIQVQFNNYVDGQISLSWKQVRIFKRGKFKYQYREHEIPRATVENPVIYDSAIVFEHRAPSNRQQVKNAPMMARLALDVNENPTDPHPLYFLHRECLNQGDNQKAIEYGDRYLQLTRDGGFIQGDVYANLALAHQRCGAVSQARRCLHLALADEPTRREFWYRLGLLHCECREWNLALAALRAATEILPVGLRQWEPQTTASIYALIGECQQNIAHDLAHRHEHEHAH